jgi:hypothetical protein
MMNRRQISSIVLVLATVAFGVGCGGASEYDAMQLRPASLTTVTETTKLEPVYFDVTNTVAVSSEAFASFELSAGATVELEVVTKDGTPLRFELLRLRKDGSTELLNAFHVDSGFALTTFVAKSDGLFLLHFPAVDDAKDIVVHMECKNDGMRCGPAQQPGQGCMVGHDCAEGLVCYPALGVCDAQLFGGTCSRPIRTAACDGLARVPVCGCDGRIFDNACLALAAGVGVTDADACRKAPPVVTR